MPVSSTVNKVTYTGDGSTDIFAYTFKIYASTELVVERLTIASGAVETGVLNTHYTVSGAGGSSGGNVTTIGTWENTSSAYKITIRRVVPLTQLIDMEDNESTPASTFEEVFDRAVMALQQLQEQISRSVLQESSQTSQIIFPSPVADNIIGWNSGGTALENKTGLAATLAACLAAQAAAEAAQSAAETAQTNAETAETNAETAETNAEAAQLAAEVAQAAAEAAAASVKRKTGTFVVGDIAANKLIVTHNFALSAPYPINVTIIDANGSPFDGVNWVGKTDTVEIDTTDIEALIGSDTWAYILGG